MGWAPLLLHVLTPACALSPAVFSSGVSVRGEGRGGTHSRGGQGRCVSATLCQIGDVLTDSANKRIGPFQPHVCGFGWERSASLSVAQPPESPGPDRRVGGFGASCVRMSMHTCTHWDGGVGIACLEEGIAMALQCALL